MALFFLGMAPSLFLQRVGLYPELQDERPAPG
jgi:hypothetical protein